VQYTYRKYRVPVSLTQDQKRLVSAYRDAQRQSYNWAVSRIKLDNPVTEYGLHKLHTAYRRKHDWLRSTPTAVQRAGIRDAFVAHKLSVRFGRGHTTYRSRKRHNGMSVKCGLAPRVEDKYTIWLPRFGTVRASIPNAIVEHEPRSYEFVQTRSGRYMLYVSCRVTIPSWNAPLNATVKGIDRGMAEPTVVVTLDKNGQVTDKSSYDTATPFKRNRQRYQKMQSKMSRMNRHSNRFRRLRARLRKKLQKIRNRRTYAECIAAKHVCQDHSPSTIVFEDLKISKMTRKGGAYKRELNREMRFVRHYAVEQRIRDRAELGGISVRIVNPHYTSQTCARCGHTDKASRVTRDMFKCTRCNYIQQADVNAAIVIGRHGLPPSDYTQTKVGQHTEVGTPFVRRQLDARLNCFSEGSIRRHESQVPARSLSPSGMEKQRHGTGVVIDSSR